MKNRGFSLLELCFAVMIVTLAIAGVSYQFSVGMEATMKNRIKLNMSIYAKSMMEEILSKKHWKEVNYCGSLWSDEGETRFGNQPYDDVDDYNFFGLPGNYESPLTSADGVAIANSRSYQRRVSIQWLNPDLTVSVSPTQLKMITITVNYDPRRSFEPPVLTYKLTQILYKH